MLNKNVRLYLMLRKMHLRTFSQKFDAYELRSQQNPLNLMLKKMNDCSQFHHSFIINLNQHKLFVLLYWCMYLGIVTFYYISAI